MGGGAEVGAGGADGETASPKHIFSVPRTKVVSHLGSQKRKRRGQFEKLRPIPRGARSLQLGPYKWTHCHLSSDLSPPLLPTSKFICLGKGAEGEAGEQSPVTGISGASYARVCTPPGPGLICDSATDRVDGSLDSRPGLPVEARK